VTVLFNSSGTLLLKLSNADPTRFSVGGFSLSPWVLAAVVCYGLNFLTFANLLRSMHVSMAYPIVVGCSFVLITLGGALLFGEALTLRHVLGWVAILAGVTVLAGS
jgi:small multidrug resistance pump